MDVKMTNASTVTRMWADDKLGELIGVFQYQGDAVKFAELACLDETKPNHVFYVVCHHYDGNVRIIRPKSDVAKAA